MGEPAVQYRLAAILAADIESYSRLMNEDERATVLAWQAAREETIKPTVAAHSGRIVKHTGDGFLAEFSTVSAAVECAIALQSTFYERNRTVPEGRRLNFRMGINLGEISVDEDDIHGDGVNIAARLERLAEAPGICVTSYVYDQVRKKVNCTFEDMGQHTVKNIAEPIHVYRIVCPPSAAPGGMGDPAAPPHVGIPSIAVLPFDNMSADPEQEFFADGLTEDLITQLSRFNDLFVISRNSTFTYKGKAAKLVDVARDLGVRYVVEGSVRRAGNRVRVNVQLIDGLADRHVWAERYDRDLEDIFAIQDEITAAIAATLPGRVEADNQYRARRIPTENMAAYECVLAGKLLHHNGNRSDNAEALKLLDRAIGLDPGYAHARAWRACVLGQAWIKGWVEGNPDDTFEEIENELARALTLDENDADIHRILAAVCISRNNFEQARHHQAKASRLNPNYDLVVVQNGELMTWLGRPEEGIDFIRQAMELNPFHPPRFWSHLGRAYFTARRYTEAIEAFEHIDAPDHIQHAFLAACHACVGDRDRGDRHVAAALEAAPDLTAEGLLSTQHYLRDEDTDHLRNALLKAGFPEA